MNSWIGWKCFSLCAAIKYLYCWWQLASLWECWIAKEGTRCEETSRSNLDWCEEWGAYVCSRWSGPPSDIEICAERQRLSGLQHDAVYVPYTNFFLHDVEAEEKVFHLCHHSKKLAIAFGLINTAPGTPLPIRENLWVHEDCHTSTKFISKNSW